LVWQTQRLFLELFQKLAEWLSDDEPIAPVVLEEQLAMLLAVAITLLRQHHVNKRGQCLLCGWTRWKWRFWRRRRRCTVHQAVEFICYRFAKMKMRMSGSFRLELPIEIMSAKFASRPL
jgi:hypothetical protein